MVVVFKAKIFSSMSSPIQSAFEEMQLYVAYKKVKQKSVFKITSVTPSWKVTFPPSV